MLLICDIEFNNRRGLRQSTCDTSCQTKGAPKTCENNGGSFFLRNLGDVKGDRAIGEDTGNENIFTLEDAHI